MSSPCQEEDEVAKTETEEKNKIDPNADKAPATDSKHIIEYWIFLFLLSHFLTSLQSLHQLVETYLY